ncbi:sugar transferase [Flavobacteriales bacterium AH-315-E23]|nr:sugar transferase [Flavobacteriales bacterium AH-315-E23]
MLKRLFDMLASFIGLIVLFPLLILIAFLVFISSKGGIIFSHPRVGLNNKDFKVYKFRTMRVSSEPGNQLTMGHSDPRITGFGKFLRRYKLDELPQLFNVLLGDMSIVGPRPEVRKYVDQYTEQQKKVLTVRPGITDYASLEYVDEGTILEQAEDAEKEYTNVVLPKKLELGIKYVEERSFLKDLSIIFRTLWRIII